MLLTLLILALMIPQYFANAMIRILTIYKQMNCCPVIFVFCIFFLISSSTQQQSPVSPNPQSSSPPNSPPSFSSIMETSTQFQHKFTTSIVEVFSNSSDMTVVVSSCNRYKYLRPTLNSFFHFNTYVLREVIIIQDCGGDTQQIWTILPQGAKEFEGRYFRVIKNVKRLGQIGSIDEAYKFVKTKYVYHMEDDWAQLGSYGALERLKDALTDCQAKQIKVSQAVLTFPEWSWSHMPSKQLRTPRHTRYYLLTSYGKDYLYSFSFNPHLINFQQLYKRELNSSYINSIARRFHCLNDPKTTIMQNGGCVEHETGKYLESAGYKQIYVELRKKSVYQHIGTKQYQVPQEINFQRQIDYEIKAPQIGENSKINQQQKVAIGPQQQLKSNATKKVSASPISRPNVPRSEQAEFLIQIGYVCGISIGLLGLFEGFKRMKKCARRQDRMSDTQSYHPTSTTDMVESSRLQLEEHEEQTDQ